MVTRNFQNKKLPDELILSTGKSARNEYSDKKVIYSWHTTITYTHNHSYEFLLNTSKDSD